MCIIIDTCTFHAVFDVRNSKHPQYRPVLDWITGKNGKIIIGGSKYFQELKGSRFISLLAEFERQKKIVKLPNHEVDALAGTLKDRIKHRDFDDEHLVAMVTVSRCKVVCTDDDRAIPFLQKHELYPKHVKRPKIYKSIRNKKLCCHNNVVAICSENS